MAVREQEDKARLHVLHFGQELFATVGAAKHGYDALNVHNVFSWYLEKFLERRAMSRKKNRGEEL